MDIINSFHKIYSRDTLPFMKPDKDLYYCK